jgi:hypothetical protein
METGFETIGNATIIAYDRGPVIATDPWVRGSAYFGSWALSHEIPEAQMEAVKSCPFVWFSHGHPDHLNAESLELCRSKVVLLPDHSGQRMRRELGAAGFEVRALPDRTWVPLSERIRVLCIADEAQNGILLLDVNGRLLVNLNDGIDRGWGRFVRKTVRRYETSILLALTGYGDADMINFRDEDGRLIEPPAARRFPVGPMVARKTESFGCKLFVPSSSMHRYQRSDSVWADPYTTPVEDHAKGFASSRCAILPAFIHYDCGDDSWRPLDPRPSEPRIRDCREFGDDWSEALSADEFETVRNYFQAFHHLHGYLDFVNVRVGGEDHVIEFARRGFRRGITFEVPRASLMDAVQYEVFDDLLIGNFMKTTLHGRWPHTQLYPHFTPYVTKYGDNGGAHTRAELRRYFLDYLRRAPLDILHHWLEARCTNAVRAFTPHDSDTYLRLKKAYWQIKAYV